MPAPTHRETVSEQTVFWPLLTPTGAIALGTEQHHPPHYHDVSQCSGTSLNLQIVYNRDQSILFPQAYPSRSNVLGKNLGPIILQV